MQILSAKTANQNAVKLIYAYLRLGIRSAMPVMPATRLPWEIMTPLGMPVEPLVYMITAISEGFGCLRSTETAEQGSDGRKNRTHINIIIKKK